MTPSQGRILIVDDDIDIQESLSDWFEAEHFDVVTASNGIDGLRCIRAEPFNLIMLDLQMPEMDGLTVLRHIEEEGIDATVVVFTAYGTIDTAVKAMQTGAFDFLTKPFESHRLRVVIDKAMERDRLRQENVFFRKQTAGPSFIGNAAKMGQPLDMARKAAEVNATVLLLGESGTGKEVLARAIHDWSPRSDRPFVSVNGVALPETLLESELFGHKKGAFTGATGNKRGNFEVANHSTLLLDEIGATRVDFQLRILRVLQENEIQRQG